MKTDNEEASRVRTAVGIGPRNDSGQAGNREFPNGNLNLMQELSRLKREVRNLKRAEKRLLHERILLRTLIDNLPDGIYAKDLSYRKTLANTADLRNMGVQSEKEVLGKDDFAFYPKEIAEQFLADDKRVILDDQPVLNREEYAVNVGGDKRWLLTSKLPLKDEHGAIVGLLGIGRDITARKEAEEALERERNLLRTLVDNIPDLIYIKDARGRFLLSNQPHVRSLGALRQEELKGKTAFHFQSREVAERGWKDERHVLRSGSPLVEQEEYEDDPFTGEQRNYLTSKIPFRDSSGTVVGIIGIQRDITEKKRLEEVSKESSEKFHLVFENAFDGIGIYEEASDPAQRRLVECNRRFADLAGRSREELLEIGYVGRLTRSVVHESRQTIISKGAFRGTFQWSRPDLKENIIEYEVVPISLRGKTYSISMDRDVTEQRKAEWKIRDQVRVIETQNTELSRARDEALEANKMKGAFLASMSHELRTPLNSIIGYSEMVLEEMSDEGNAKYAGDIERIQAAGRHLLGLINDILDLSKIEAGKMDLYLEDFDLGTVIQEVVATLQPLFQKNRNRFVLKQEEGLPQVHLDLTKVRQILFNLLSNASKFTHEGSVTLAARLSPVIVDQHAGIILQVSDTGIGLSDEQKENLFKDFSQADKSTSRKYGGTGLGLAITKRLTDMMHGTISIESSMGKGTTFTIIVPQSLDAGKEPAAVVTACVPDLPDGSTSNAVVLVIDDDPGARDLLSRYLTKEGFTVACATSGEEGLQKSRLVSPMAIILDVLLPQKDGWATLQELKNDPVLSGVPVIMYTMVDERNFGIAIGASEYLIKPVSGEKIVEVVSKYRKSQPADYVLVVDDDPDLRDLAGRSIERAGWYVETAENGESALAVMEKRLPGIIFLDLMMPVMDGFEFLAEFQNHDEWRHVPIVAVTSKDLSQEDRQRLNGVVKGVIQKGVFTPDQLLKQLSTLIPRLARRSL